MCGVVCGGEMQTRSEEKWEVIHKILEFQPWVPKHKAVVDWSGACVGDSRR